MSRKSGKYSKKDFDRQFEAFMKESVSSEESFDSGKISKYFDTPKKKQWWNPDDDDDDESEGSDLLQGKSFMKSKKFGPKHSTPVDDDKTVSKTAQFKEEEEGRLGSPESRKSKQKPRGKNPVPAKARGMRKTDASASRDSLEDISEKSEEDSAQNRRRPAPDSSLDTNNGAHMYGTGGDKGTRLGIDTLDEIADKEKFFKDLEGEDSVDYGKLNRELSQTTISPGIGTKKGSFFSQEETQDFQTGGIDHKGQPHMLSNVMLDSMDSTMNTTQSPKVTGKYKESAGDSREHAHSVPNTMKNGTDFSFSGNKSSQDVYIYRSFIGTNTGQEIEALHRALEEVGMSTTVRHDEHGREYSVDEVDGQLSTENGKKSSGEQRTVDDILREMDAIQQKAKSENGDYDVKLTGDYVSPKHVAKNRKGLERQHNTEIQLKEDPHTHSESSGKEGRGFERSHTDDTEVYQPITAVGDFDYSIYESVSQRGGKRKNKTKQEIRDLKEKSPDSPRRGGKKKRDKFQHIQSSGYGRGSPGKSPTRNKQTTSPRAPERRTISRTGQSPSRNKTITKENSQGNPPDSLEMFAQYMNDHFKAKVPEPKTSFEEPVLSNSWKRESMVNQSILLESKQWQERFDDERQMHAKLKAAMNAMERDYERQLENQKLTFEEELFKLKQENYVLGAKVSESGDDLKKKVAEGGTLEGISKEQMDRLEKEIREQESLIVGYQNENKRLYVEVKKIQQQNKQTEERMFKENQKLSAEVVSLKSKLEQKEIELRNKGVITSPFMQQQIAAGNTDTAVLGAEKIAFLESELKQSKKNEEYSKREQKILEKSRAELEQHIDKMLKERTNLQQRLDDSNKMKPEERKILEEKYEQEMNKLHKKVKWYAENQAFLDKSTGIIKAREEEINSLKQRIHQLQTEAGQKLEENKLRTRERAADAKKIQDLERQVKEMEQIIKKRHPNSIPALMMAAAAAVPDSQQDKAPSLQYFENKIRKLEKELAQKDEEMESRLRGVEQKYTSVKIQYEERVKELEIQLEGYKRAGLEHPHTSTTALEKELESVRERYKRQIADLQVDVERLTNEVTKMKRVDEMTTQKELRSSQELETDLRHQVRTLQKEVENKSHDIEVLQKSLERARKEKQLFTMNGLSSGVAVEQGERKKGKGRGSNAKKLENGEIKELNIPAPQMSQVPEGFKAWKEYKPNNFADVHISDVLEENETLQTTVEQLELELQQQRVDLRKSLAETESVARQSKESYEETIEFLKSSHQKELQSIIAQQALQQSTTKSAELQAKVDSQEVMIKHLQHSLANAQVESEKLSILKIREATLESQVKQLHDDLREAKRFHTPAMKHFEVVQEKIVSLEKKQELREQELQQIIKNTQKTASDDLDQEREKWKKVVDGKNNEIQKFRAELDSILEVLKLLQKQGVLIPVNSNS